MGKLMTDIPALRALLAEANADIPLPAKPEGEPYSEEVAKAWLAEHGHDIRLKCYPEFGCWVQSRASQAIFDALPALLTELEGLQLLRRRHGRSIGSSRTTP